MRTLLTCLVVASALAPAAAAACDCPYAEPEPAQALKGADVVVDGVVIKVADGEFVLEVNRTFKGVPSPRLTVRSPTSDCGYRFQPGMRVLLYARRAGAVLEVEQCQPGVRVRWGTAAVDAEAKVLVALEDGGR